MISMRSIARAVRKAFDAQQRQLVEAERLASLHRAQREQREREMEAARAEQARKAALDLLEKPQRQEDAEDRRLAEMSAAIMRRQAKLS
ncbi:hypothetical protein ACSBOB_20360 [Mesorhizobium sp. ASY16-5R]|uniref:hypothetical protein n=1 Tax=Mesorhizobium sp. ASY16-5R TaxID=3445772 RepID=UPI003FA14299